MDKEQTAIARLQAASEMSLQVYKKPLVVTTSGGKDSTVCVALAERAGIPFEAIHNHTTVDAPETVRFVRGDFRRLEEKGVKCTIDFPIYKGQRVTMWSLIPQMLMPPTRTSRYCCSVLKERGGRGRFITTGVRWAESVKRKNNRGIYETMPSDPKKKIILNNDNDDRRRLFETCTIKAKRTCNPIIDWTDREVWDYIRAERLPVNPLYECGYFRVGCIGCPMAGTVARQFRKIALPRMYRYSCGSVPGRGPHFAVRTMKRWRDGYNGCKFYVAELDIKGFYDNVDVELLKTMLQKAIRDKRYLDLLFRVIDGGAPGLPKGFYTSPWFANFMLTPLDNYITQVLRPDHYLRFMDNMFLFSRNKKQLHKMVTAIEEYLGEKLHLQLKEDWQVFRFEYEPTPIQRARAEKRQKRRPPRRTRRKKRERKEWGRAINCLGFVIHHNRVTIRKSILKRTRAKANRIKRKGKLPVRDAASMVSRMGWFKFTDTYNYYLKWIKPKISIQYCKRRISAKAKKKGVNKK